MGIFRILLQKEVITFKNSYLKTARQTLISLALLIFGFLVIAGITWAFLGRIRPLLATLPPSQRMLLTTPLFHLILLWFLLSSFLSMLQEARPKFYLSPELSLLVSTPVPAATLFIFRFILFTCFSTFALGNLAIFILPPLIALGIATATSWCYYLFILPVAYLLMIIPASLGVFLSMLLIRILPAKRIMQVTVVFNLLLGALWIGFFILGPEKTLSQLLNWIEVAEPILAIFFPLTEAATTLNRLIQGELVMALGPLLRLFLTSGVVLVGSMLAAQKLYYQGYDRSQMVEVFTKRPVEQPIKEKLPIFLGRRSYLILTEWKKAVRNHEMGQGTIALVIMLFIYLLITGGFVPPEPWRSLVLLGHIGVVGFLASGAVAILFVPMAVVLQQDVKFLKEQYWLLKVAPLRRGEFIWCYWLALLLPQLLFGGAILLLTNIFMGSSILIILLSLVVLALLVGSFGALKLGTDMVGYGGQGEVTTVIGGIVLQILPFLYYILALGILALGQIYTQIRLLSFMHHWPQGLVITISGAIFLTLVGFTFYYSFRLGAWYWERMEI